MAKHKNKTEIIDSIILKEHKSSKSYDYWWWDDSDYWDYDDFYDWEYDLEDPDLYKEKYINKRGGRVYQTTHIIGKKINMESAYSKQNLRQMKLEAILEGKNYQVRKFI